MATQSLIWVSRVRVNDSSVKTEPCTAVGSTAESTSKRRTAQHGVQVRTPCATQNTVYRWLQRTVYVLRLHSGPYLDSPPSVAAPLDCLPLWCWYSYSKPGTLLTKLTDGVSAAFLLPPPRLLATAATSSPASFTLNSIEFAPSATTAGCS